MKENENISLKANRLRKKRVRYKKMCFSFFVFLFVLIGLLVSSKESVYAINETVYPRHQGYADIHVYVDGAYTSYYRLNCKYSGDISEVGSLAPLEHTGGWSFYVQDGQAWVEQWLDLYAGPNTMQTNGWAWTDVDGAYWLPYNTRQYHWVFSLKTALKGYHLNNVTQGEGSIQTHCWGYEDGRFWIMADTNGIGITNFIDGIYRNNTYNVWLVANDYTVTFNPNGGLIDGGNEGGVNHTVKYNHTDDMPAWCNSTRTYRTGYTLLGWYDAWGNKVVNADGSKNLYATDYWDSTGRWIGLSDVTLYAHWTPNIYNITYNGNGGTRNDTGEASYSNKATFDASYHIDKNYFAKDGYLFLGWSTSPDGPVSSTWLPDTDITMKTPNNITLYAVWEKIKWTASGTKENGDTVFGVNTAIAGNVNDLSSLCNIIKSKFLLNSNISINPWESGVDYATPLEYMQYGDMNLYLYVNVESEDVVFTKITYEFDTATGIETVEKDITDKKDDLTVQIPTSIAYDEVYSVKVTIENSDENIKASQMLYFTYKKMNLDELLSRIRNQ